MAMKDKTYLDYTGLKSYDRLIKSKITSDVESLGTFLESEIGAVSRSVDDLSDYVNVKFEESVISDDEIEDLFEE